MGTNIEYKLQVDLISCKYTKLTTDVDIFKNCGLASLESKIVKMHQSHTHTHTHTQTHTHIHYRDLCGVTELVASAITMQWSFVILFGLLLSEPPSYVFEFLTL